MKHLYRHTQFSYVRVVVLGLVLIYVAATMFSSGHMALSILLSLILLALLITFVAQTVEVSSEIVKVGLGPGIQLKTIPIDEIVDCCVIRTTWKTMMGFGRPPSNPTYGISGLDAVDLDLRNGSSIRIGTDEPDKLAKVIEDAMIARKSKVSPLEMKHS